MEAQAEQEQKGLAPDRWTLLRDIVALQFKLVVDGLRDFVLVPISLLVGFVSLVKAGHGGGGEFYELLRAGRRTERWINLFGAAERVYGPPREDEAFPAEDIDRIVQRVETFMVDEYARGGVTRQAKERLDRALDALHELAARRHRRDTGGADDDTA